LVATTAAAHVAAPQISKFLGCHRDFQVLVSFNFLNEKSDTGFLEKTDPTLLNSFLRKFHHVLATLNTPFTIGLTITCTVPVTTFAADPNGAIIQTLAAL
jgi:hypothetical protein